MKGTVWTNNISGDDRLFFDEKRNIVSVLGDLVDAVYTVNDTKITFDLSSWIVIYKNMTVDKYIQGQKLYGKKQIAELEDMINKESNAEKKKELERKLQHIKEELQALENPTKEVKEDLAETVQSMKKVALAFENHAKFAGEFNSEKIELTIETFPHYDQGTEKVTVQKVIFKKNK